MSIKNKAIRFLIVSLAVILILCGFIFGFLAFHMNSQNVETINEVGTIYMTGMSERITMHFETTVEFHLSHLESIVNANPPKSDIPEAQLREQLAYEAEARGFLHLSLYDREGNMEVLYGDEITVSDPQPFRTSLLSGEKKVAVGTNSAGERIILLGIPAEYRLSDGEKSVAAVAGLPVSYIQQILSLDESDTLVHSHIIRRNGSFVIRSGDAYRENYFDRLRSTLVMDDPEERIRELEAAMDTRSSYSSVLHVVSSTDGQTERQHIYCVPLPSSEWYLVVVLPYGQLDEALNQLSNQWITMVLGSCLIIVLALLVVFAKYFLITNQQIQDLDAARVDAERASRAKSEFLSNMSHDIRTPMNGIVGMTAIAIANINNIQQVQHCLKKISLSSKHLLGLINDVLDMSKIESGKLSLNMDLVSLREVMDNIVNIVQPQVRVKQQRFDVIIHDIDTENVYCDGVRINQVLINLISNAIKFTPEGGSIQVTLYEEPSPKGNRFTQVHLLVKDNGIGMSPEFQAKIFDSFSREDRARVQKTEGTGLGMAITKYIVVDAMEGTIGLESAPGQGTEFHITVDLEKADTSEVDMVLPSWDMLVVDDDEEICHTAAASLKEIGVRADWALDGETALKMAEQRHKNHNDYHIILLDWKLPGMDGIQTARELRRRCGKDTPILIISAYDWGEIEKQAREAGVCGFISKPLFKSTLFYGLRQFAGGGSSEVEAVPAREKVDLSRWRVLLAEDNDLNWEIAQELLEEQGLTLERAENGKICADMFAASQPGYYDGILMDIRMPVMTGYEATEAIRAMDHPDAKEIPIIAMTADAFSEDMQKCLDCGMNAHIAKPIDVDVVARLLTKYIEQRAHGGE